MRVAGLISPGSAAKGGSINKCACAVHIPRNQQDISSYSTGQYIWSCTPALPEKQNHLLVGFCLHFHFPEEFSGVSESFRVTQSPEPRTKTRTMGVEFKRHELGEPLWKQNYKLWSCRAEGGSDTTLLHAETINILWQEWCNMDAAAWGPYLSDSSSREKSPDTVNQCSIQWWTTESAQVSELFSEITL